MGFSLAERMRNLQDRQALRWRSMVFGGYPEDLAAGIPLLRYFGGVDEWAESRYSPERQEQIVDMIRGFVGPRAAEPSIQTIGP